MIKPYTQLSILLFQPSSWTRGFLKHRLLSFRWFELRGARSAHAVEDLTQGSKPEFGENRMGPKRIQPHSANGPWNKSLNFIFPTEYVIPKKFKV